MQKILDEYDFELEEDIVNKLNEKYDYDLDGKLVATVRALNKVGKEENLTDDELNIVNLFLSEEKVSVLDFLEIENYDDEEIFEKLGKYAVMELPFNFKELVKELWTIIEQNKEEFNFIVGRDYDKLKKEIKAIEQKYPEELKNNSYKTIYVLNAVDFYITSLNDKYSSKASLNITERYFSYKGWKLVNNLAKNVNDIIKKQREKRTENYEQLWKFRNMYNSSDKIELYIYGEILLSDLKKIERYYRELSIESNLTKAKAENVVNYYTYTLMMMYMANVENSQGIVLDIWKKNISLDSEIEKYIVQGAVRAKELLLKNKPFPSPRQIVKKLNITKGRAEKYDLNLLYLDTLSSGTRNRLLGKDKPQDLQKIVKDSKIERVEQGKKFFEMKQESGMTNAEIAEQCECSRKRVGLKIDDYIREEYKIKSKNKNFDENEFIEELGITKSKLVKIIK